MGRLLEEEQVGGGADQGAQQNREDDEGDEGSLGAVAVGDDDGGEGGFFWLGCGRFLGIDVFAAGGASGRATAGQRAFLHADGLEEEGGFFAESVAGVVERGILGGGFGGFG